MKDLPLNSLRAFVIVYSEGGVRAAARALGIAHSSVVRHVAELEAWLGVSLTDDAVGPGRRGIALTSQGEALAKAALTAFRDIEQATTAVRETRSANSVTLSTAPSFAARWLLPRLRKFETAYPGIELSILVEQKLVDPDGRGVDFAIRMGRGGWPALHCEALLDEVLYPVMSRAYWERWARPSKPADLAHLRLLHDRDPHTSWEMWKKAYGPEALNVRRGPRFTSTDLLLHAAAQGHGVALARHRLAEDDVAAGRLLRPIPELQVVIGPNYWIVLPAHGRPKRAANTVLNWLKNQANLSD